MQSIIKESSHLIFLHCSKMISDFQHSCYNSPKRIGVICYEMATIAFTDSGVYFLNGKDYYIPYSKIVDVGMQISFSRKEVYFDVKTALPHRQCFFVRTANKKDSEFVDNTYQLLMLMTGMSKPVNIDQ